MARVPSARRRSRAAFASNRQHVGPQPGQARMRRLLRLLEQLDGGRLETHGHPVSRLHHGARQVPRPRPARRGAIEVPASRHAEVTVQHRAARKTQQEMFAPCLHPLHDASDHAELACGQRDLGQGG